MFGISDLSRIFAVFSPRTFFLLRYMDFLYPCNRIISLRYGCSYSLVGYISLRSIVFFGENNREANSFLFYTQLKIPTTMPKNEGIRVNAKNSNVSSTSAHETSIFSWETVANLLNRLPMGVCECRTIQDAKDYVKAFVILTAVFLLAGLEGGAL